MIGLLATVAHEFAIIFKGGCRLLLIACLMAGSLTAADNPFLERWKLDSSKSRLPDEMKIKKVSANKYAFGFEGGDYTETGAALRVEIQRLLCVQANGRGPGLDGTWES